MICLYQTIIIASSAVIPEERMDSVSQVVQLLDEEQYFGSW
jgi:hypothetical protein